MKIITMHQPWASFVAELLKLNETRHWPTGYRGSLLIHAAKRPMRTLEIMPILYAVGGGGCPNDQLKKLDELLDRFMASREQILPLGCIVAIADLADCRRMVSDFNYPRNAAVYRECRIAISDQSVLERAVGLWEPDRYALRFDNVRKLEPIPFTSRQGKLLDAPSEIIALVNQQLEQAA